MCRKVGHSLRSMLHVAIMVHLVASFITGQAATLSPRAYLEPISLPIHALEKRSPADNSTFGAGLGALALSGDRQSYYTVIQVGGINFRVALDTASADLWLVSSGCVTDACKGVPSYPLTYNSPTFVSLSENSTQFYAHYADHTFASGFLAGETVQIANLTLSNQTFALITDANVTLTDMMSGILGLGFPRLSSFSAKNFSLPFFASLTAKGLLEYPLFGFSLTMNSSGTLTLGAIDASIVKNPALISWHQVTQFPPFAAESTMASYLEWAIPLNAFSVNGTSFVPTPTYSNRTLVLFDIGSPGIYGSYQDVFRIFGAIPGARLVDSGQWVVPCDTTLPISFTFGTRTFHLLPTDYLRGPASGNPNLCLSWPIALPPGPDGIDWQFGSAFLRTVYSIFSYGINEKEPPMIGLYPLRNATNISALTQSPSDIQSFLSAHSATIPTTLPNYLLSTPTFTTPPYTFNSSVTAVLGGIATSELANTTYTPIFGQKTVLENVSALPTISPPPSVVTLTVTDSGRVSTTTKTYLIPSVTLGLSMPSSAISIICSNMSIILQSIGALFAVNLWTWIFTQTS